jgi:hypothetical protein
MNMLQKIITLAALVLAPLNGYKESAEAQVLLKSHKSLTTNEYRVTNRDNFMNHHNREIVCAIHAL